MALYLSMGPSGAGKDTLLLGAREALAGDGRVHFIRRRLTRAADKITDIEESVTHDEFAAAEAAGEHAFSWAAHDTRYAIPHAALNAALAKGGRCLLNVSRTIVDAALAYGEQRGVEVYCLYITCSEATLRQRLLSRGREDAAAVDSRLARSRSVRPFGDHVLTITNEASVEQGVKAVVRTLLGEPGALGMARARTRNEAAAMEAADALQGLLAAYERARRRAVFVLFAATVCAVAVAHTRR